MHKVNIINCEHCAGNHTEKDDIYPYDNRPEILKLVQPYACFESSSDAIGTTYKVYKWFYCTCPKTMRKIYIEHGNTEKIARYRRD